MGAEGGLGCPGFSGAMPGRAIPTIVFWWEERCGKVALGTSRAPGSGGGGGGDGGDGYPLVAVGFAGTDGVVGGA